MLIPDSLFLRPFCPFCLFFFFVSFVFPFILPPLFLFCFFFFLFYFLLPILSSQFSTESLLPTLNLSHPLSNSEAYSFLFYPSPFAIIPISKPINTKPILYPSPSILYNKTNGIGTYNNRPVRTHGSNVPLLPLDNRPASRHPPTTAPPPRLPVLLVLFRVVVIESTIIRTFLCTGPSVLPFKSKKWATGQRGRPAAAPTTAAAKTIPSRR